jgi:hypothetical protein
MATHFNRVLQGIGNKAIAKRETFGSRAVSVV